MSDFCDPHHGHIVSGNLNIIKNKQLRELMCYGPGYRETQKVKWDKYLNDVKTSLMDCITKWAQQEQVDIKLLIGWYNEVMEGCEKVENEQ